MNRVNEARRAFSRKDVALTRRMHGRKVVQKAIMHKEHHVSDFRLPEIILGGQDGLVNVLGVILGIAAATGNNQIVIVAGLAATFAESISMAAVAYTSKLAEADYYQSEYEREKWEIEHIPDGEREEIRALYARLGFSGKTLHDIVAKITADKKIWLQVMMEQELKLEPVSHKDAFPAALIVGVSALVGSFIPLTAYFFLPISIATVVSLVISSLTLFTVGYYKAQKTLGRKFIRSGIEMTIIGMVSALVGYVIGSLFKIPPTP